MSNAASRPPRLIVFTDTTRAAPPQLLARYESLAQRAVAQSVLFVVRDYQLGTRARLELGKELAQLTRRHAQRFGIADRADLALALDSDAFHLPEAGLSPVEARQLLGPRIFLSRGSHPVVGVAAVEAPPPDPELDAVLLSPACEARKGRPALGALALSAVISAGSRAECARRAAYYALGGVDSGNAAQCLAAGAHGVAVIGAALAPDPEPLLGALGLLAPMPTQSG